MPGGPELLIVLGIVVLLFGADKIPRLANSIGKSVGEFKRGRIVSEKRINDENGDIHEE